MNWNLREGEAEFDWKARDKMPREAAAVSRLYHRVCIFISSSFGALYIRRCVALNRPVCS